MLKKHIFSRLDDVCKPTAVLSSNTSSISITRLAAATKRPENVVRVRVCRERARTGMAP